NWVDAGDPSNGYCNSSQSASNTDVEIVRDGAFGYGIRLKDNNVSATRSVNLSGATKAFLSFTYRRKSNTMTTGQDVLVQASSNGSTFTTIYTIAGDGTTDAGYITVFNQDILTYAGGSSAIRFVTNSAMSDNDSVYIGNVSVRYLRYNQCYITQLATSSIGLDYYTTSSIQRNTTFTSGGTCASNFDFGVAKLSITVSGTLFNDANGKVDNLVNGTAIGQPGGTTIYAYLVDSLNKIAFQTTVNSTNGTYSFTQANVNTQYSLALSTINAAVNATVPPATLPTLWVSVGDAYGINNAAGSSLEPGVPNTSVAVRTAYTNVTNVNFGIERLPNSDNHLRSIPHPTMNQLITLNGGVNPPVLSGSDPEDCSGGALLTSRSVIIDTIPDNANLLYNNVLVTNGQLITNFNPTLLQIRITPATLGDTLIKFRYSFVDAATMKDQTPATYTLVWNIALPADALIAVAQLNGSVATIKWSTLSESNTDYFILERSVDNINFTATGNRVEAAENSTSKKEYQQPDDISSLSQYSIIYYRVKLVDIDAKFKYSNIVAVRLNKTIGITAWPNPFVSTITVNITASHKTDLTISLNDMSGKTVFVNSQQAAKGTSQVTLSGLERLAQGVYLLNVADKSSGNKTVYKFVKQ
ncbi:MAG: T9SS type A sorting domain-containing protein, partial [Ferruginibacter sp.]|nr:T9SS type A sorting domain-containing protein [Chitinophagaceae bacterium]